MTCPSFLGRFSPSIVNELDWSIPSTAIRSLSKITGFSWKDRPIQPLGFVGSAYQSSIFSVPQALPSNNPPMEKKPPFIAAIALWRWAREETDSLPIPLSTAFTDLIVNRSGSISTA